MIRQFGFAILLLALSACSTMQRTPHPRSASGADVRVLFGYPHATYTSLGTFNFEYRYLPGSREPSVTDALPSLRADALSVGGNALIVRDQGHCWAQSRCIDVATEVLRVEWSVPGRVRP